MAIVKARQQGDATIITLPSTLEIEAGDEFFVIKKDNGAISLIPKTENPFKDAEEGEFYTPEENIDYSPRGNEVDGI